MYCDGCGATINPGMAYCQRCGKPIAGMAGGGQAGAPTAQSGYGPGRVRRNIQPLAALWMVLGFLRFMSLAMLVILRRFVVPLFNSMPSPPSGNASHGVSWSLNLDAWAFPFVARFGFAFFPVLGLAYLIAGWGLYQRKPWARILTLILGFFALLQFPLGTALGIYTIWVLLPENSRVEYDGMARG